MPEVNYYCLRDEDDEESSYDPRVLLVDKYKPIEQGDITYEYNYEAANKFKIRFEDGFVLDLNNFIMMANILIILLLLIIY